MDSGAEELAESLQSSIEARVSRMMAVELLCARACALCSCNLSRWVGYYVSFEWPLG